MDCPAGVKKVAGTGTEQTRFRSGKQGGVSNCDAECEAFLANRVELFTRAVILVAGMNLAEAQRAAVLARVIADMTSPTSRILDESSRQARHHRSHSPPNRPDQFPSSRWAASARA